MQPYGPTNSHNSPCSRIICLRIHTSFILTRTCCACASVGNTVKHVQVCEHCILVHCETEFLKNLEDDDGAVHTPSPSLRQMRLNSPPELQDAAEAWWPLLFVRDRLNC